MVVKLTQEQADYLKTFDGKKNTAIYFISRWGFGYFLEDGNRNKYTTNCEAPFSIDEKEKMLNAIINGYEVIAPKFKFHTFSNITDFESLYYAGKGKQLTADYEKAEEVEKNSEEYVALENLEFLKEEV